MTTIYLLIMFNLYTQDCIESIQIIEISHSFERESGMTTCGTITPYSEAQSLLACSKECPKHDWCTGILFKRMSNQHNCLLISMNISMPNEFYVLSGYKHFAMKPEPTVSCINMGIPTPLGWRSGCPKLYFPLDSDQSPSNGGSSANADFGTDGKIGKSVYLENGNSTPHAYLSLGNAYTSDQYCFPEPSSCVNGVSLAFWMNIPVEPPSTSGYHSYITTRNSKGPGFVLFWFSSHGLVSAVKRDFDTREDYFAIMKDDFVADYGFNNWVHYVITYRCVPNGHRSIYTGPFI